MHTTVSKRVVSPKNVPRTLEINLLIARLAVVVALFASACDARAIGDSGGCAFDSQYARVLSLGSVSDVESYVSSTIARRAGFLDRTQQKVFKADPSQRKASKDNARRKLLQDQMTCSIDFPLDYAVGHGNLAVVQWLLDSGVDPTAASGGRNVFTRCRSAGYGIPVGMSKEQALERQLDAYRMLIARGADINALDPFHAIYGCLKREMLPVLKQLGARVTRDAFESRVRSARTAGGAINELRWAEVEQLAKWQAFDFRGTRFEADLLMSLDARSDMPDYAAVVELTKRLATIVRLSPGIVPDQPARSEDIPARFTAARERCFFPEISAYPDFEFVALWRDAIPGLNSSSPPDATDVRVGRTKAPVLLVLVNNRAVPTTWRISRSNDAQILGVIVMDSSSTGRGSKDALSFDPLRPAFLGEGFHCTALILPQSAGQTRNELRPYWSPRPGTHSYDPFRLRGEPAISTSQGSQFVVGEVPASAVMTSWPDSIRAKAPAPKP